MDNICFYYYRLEKYLYNMKEKRDPINRNLFVFNKKKAYLEIIFKKNINITFLQFG